MWIRQSSHAHSTFSSMWKLQGFTLDFPFEYAIVYISSLREGVSSHVLIQYSYEKQNAY